MSHETDAPGELGPGVDERDEANVDPIPESWRRLWAEARRDLQEWRDGQPGGGQG